MSQIKDYVKMIEGEIALKLAGYQTNFVEARQIESSEKENRYQLLPSPKTRTHFEDIVATFRKNFKNGLGCYQIPENEVPHTKLLDGNFRKILNFREIKDKKSKEKSFVVVLDKKINPKNLLCIAPNITQQIFELIALEEIQNQNLIYDSNIRHQIENYKKENFIDAFPFFKSLFGQEKISLQEFEKTILKDKDYHFLNDINRKGTEEQRDFVNKALSTPDFAILNGPPGSGKTTSIIELIYQLLLRQKRILLVASTNVAVDNILEKIYPNLQNFSAKRYGDSDNERISFIGKNFLSGKNFATLESKSWKERLKNPQNPAQEKLCSIIDPKLYEKNKTLYEILEDSAPIVAGTTFGAAIPEIKKLFRTSEFSIEQPFDYLIIDEASKTTIQEFLVPAILCKHWIIIGDIKQLPPYVEDCDLAYNLQMLYPEDAKEKKEFTVASDTLLVSKTFGNNQICILVEKESDYDSFLYKKYAKENNILVADADNPEDFEILPYAAIILGSIKSFNSFHFQISPRVTTVRPACDVKTGRILHEEELQEWLALARYNREKILKRFGENYPREWHDEMSWRMIRLFEERDNIINIHNDIRVSLKKDIENLFPKYQNGNASPSLEKFRQIYLPSCMELFLRGFGENRDTALFRGIPQEFLKSRMTTLSYQHRSHPEIAQIASEEFYEGKAMKSEHMQGKREWNYTRYVKCHNFFADIKGKCNFRNCNQKEIDWISKELRAFKNFAQKSGGKYSVAVLSFYKEQAEKLKQECKKIFGGKNNNVHYEAGSVDSFQGHEADIVFLSYTNNHPTCFLEAPNRLNVAITRAKYMMVHVGNWKAMSKSQGALGRIAQKLAAVRKSF